jgi:predicted nucleotidyltransferase
MKENILFSKTIRKLLSVFVTSPQERFYLRQLCVLTDTSPRPVQLALKKLENAGILNSQREANIKFYTLNKQSPIYSEMKGIILKTEAVGELLRDGLKKLENIKCAFIYGSVAKDKERSSSDIDICIVGNVDLNTLSSITAHLEEKLKREISVVTFSPQEWREAAQEKKALVRDILKNKKIILMGKLDQSY